MIPEMQDYIDAKLSIMELNRVFDGKCECGDENCKALHKHPKMSNWHKIKPDHAKNSMDFWESYPDFAPMSAGWVLEPKHIVIDVDKRNGGLESLKQLETDLGYSLFDKCNTIVETGGGGYHFVFIKPEDVKVTKVIKGYQGIDIKTHGGFVVIAGSMHQSGNKYEWHSFDKSDLENIADIPKDLLDKCESKAIEITIDDGDSDVDTNDLIEAINCIDPDIDYHDWINIGMAVHYATNGEGFKIWDDWSSRGTKYQPHESAYKWSTFSKKDSNVTEATIFHIAKEYGYESKLNGLPEVVLDLGLAKNTTTPIPLLSREELKKPPGIVGDIVNHINGNCLFKRRWMAVGAALIGLSTVIGQRRCTLYDTRFNLIGVLIANSTTGKESIASGMDDIIACCDGLDQAVYGNIKSEQEIYRNLLEHQVALYSVDEFGIQLAKIKNASKSGASYHEGTIATILSAFTKANKGMRVTGDLKRSLMENLEKKMVKLQGKIDDNGDETGKLYKLLDDAEKEYEAAKKGINEPYLSICGYTTPSTFESAIDDQSIMQGDVGRMLLFKEYDSNPMPDMKYKGKKKMPGELQERIRKIYGDAWVNANSSGKIEYRQEPELIPFDSQETENTYTEIYKWFYMELAEQWKDDNMQAIVRRSPEMMNKIMGVLACEGKISIEDVRYAFSLVYYDLIDKKQIATIRRGEGSKHMDDKVSALEELIKETCADKIGATRTMIKRKCQKFKAEDVDTMIDKLIEADKLEEKSVKVGSRVSNRIVLIQ